MASLFGSVATEVGGAIKENVNTRIEDRRIDDDAQREMQLQKQRMMFDSSELDKRIGADDKRQVRQNDYETTMYERETEDAATVAETAHGNIMEVEGLRAETDIAQEYIKSYLSRSASRSMSGNGWKVEFDREQVVDPSDPSGFSMREYVNAQGPGGRPYKIEGEHAYPAGESNSQAYDFGGDIGQKRAAEGGLFNGEINAQEFKDAYGYIPSAYIFGQVSREDSGLQKSMERDGIRMPVWMHDKDDRRNKSGRGGAMNEAAKEELPNLSGEILDMVNQASEEFGVPANLIEAVIAAESSGDPKAKSGAYGDPTGLMQLANDAASDMGVTDREDPAQNIAGGTKYLSQLIDKYDGDVAKALAAYNHGMTNAEPYIDSGPDWLTRAPEATQKYINRIMGQVGSQPEAPGGALAEAETAETEVAGPPAPEVEAEPVAEAEYVDPSQVPTGSDVGAASKGELTSELASDIADSIVSWFTGGYYEGLDLNVSGKEQDMMVAKHGKTWADNPEAVDELRAIQAQGN
jgi:hypothetical protein